MTAPRLSKKDRVASVVVLAVLLTVGIALVIVLPRQVDERVTLDVTCESGAEVVGVWVEAANGGSGFAERSADEEPFAFVLSFGGPYYLNVGCGGTRQSWAVETRSAQDDQPLRTLRCQDLSTAAKDCLDEPVG